MTKLPRPRLLPLMMTFSGALCAAKAGALWTAAQGGGAAVLQLSLIQPAAASAPAPARAPSTSAAHAPAPVVPAAAPATAPAAVPAPAPEPPDPVLAAERAVLESLRGRRTALEGREQALSAREAVLAAAERRLTARLDELAALQARLEEMDRSRTDREEAGWRGLVKTYETMKPRDAAGVFDELDMPVLVQIMDRMREAKAAPVLGAMRPERARMLTAELARLRARKAD